MKTIYYTLVFICIGFVLNACIGKEEPKCYYIDEQRVLFLDDNNYKFEALRMNVYNRAEMEGGFEEYWLRFKDEVDINTIDLDEIDTSLLVDYTMIEIHNIENAASLSFSRIYINKAIEQTEIGEYRIMVNVSKTSPVTKCERVH